MINLKTGTITIKYYFFFYFYQMLYFTSMILKTKCSQGFANFDHHFANDFKTELVNRPRTCN